MRKATKIGFIAVFCAAVGLTFPVFNIFSKQLSMDSHENRLMTGLPQVLQSPLSQLPRSLDNFFVDNSPFRYQFVLLNAGIDYAVFGTSQSDQVLPGKDGWLFYKDGPTAAQPVANYQGLTDINDSPEVLAQASAKLQILNDRLAENGCTLVLDLTPSKDRIYREYMPDGYPIVNEENRTDLLAGYLQSHTTVPVNWPYQELRRQARRTPTGCCTTRPTHTGIPSVRCMGWTKFLMPWACPFYNPGIIPWSLPGPPPAIWPTWPRCTPACRRSKPTRCPATLTCLPKMTAWCGSSAIPSASITCRIWRHASPPPGESTSTALIRPS